MEDAIKASIAGLKRVDQARRLKGWNRQSASWAQAALTTVSTLKQFWRRERVQRDTFIRICEAVDVHHWREIADTRPQQITIADWAEAPEVPFFCDRQTELRQLEQFILDEQSKIVMILGLSGIGKTTLAVKLVEEIQSRFEYVIWRSLRSTSHLKDLLLELIHFLSSPQQRPNNRLRRLLSPRSTDVQPHVLAHLEDQDMSALLSLLLSQLRDHRCLLILDDVDSLFQDISQPESRLGLWKPEAADYQFFIQRIRQERHQSCLVLISQEPPQELCYPDHGIACLPVPGLSIGAGQQLVQQIAPINASDRHWQDLIAYYDGHPYMLKIVAGVVHQFMQGDVSRYLTHLNRSPFVLAALSDLLEGYLQPLSSWEIEVVEQLAIADHALNLQQLQQQLSSPQAQVRVIDTLTSLQQRSLIRQTQQHFSLAAVLRQHVRQRMAEQPQSQVTDLHA